MAPVSRRTDADCCTIKGDRKTRKPLVEKKRRARINESLHELRLLITDPDAQTKMENAEVLEMSVKHVESFLQNRAKAADNMNREASERFAAGYIQCMHEVHTFVSNCPSIDATIAADLLNHLLECMPLNDEDRFQDLLSGLMGDANVSTWQIEGIYPVLSPHGGSAPASQSFHSPSPSSTSSDDLCSDLEETDTEHGHVNNRDPQQNLPTIFCSKSVWRPW